MERLFEDLFIPERDQVYLAVHCLESDTHAWWMRARKNKLVDAPPVTWMESQNMLFEAYFPNSVQERMEDDLKRLRQGGRTIQEYLREFTHLLGCAPFVAQNDRHRANLFERRLRLELYQQVQV